MKSPWAFGIVAAAIIILWLFHFSEVFGTGGMIRGGKNESSKRHVFACELIFNGFFLTRESAWGPLKMAELDKEWERLECQSLIVTCGKLAGVSVPDGRGGGMLRTMWEDLQCKGSLRTAAAEVSFGAPSHAVSASRTRAGVSSPSVVVPVAPPTPIILAPAPLPTVSAPVIAVAPSAPAGGASAGPPTPRPLSPGEKAISLAEAKLGIKSPTPEPVKDVLPSPTTMLAIPSPTTMLAIPSPTTMLAIPSPTTMLANAGVTPSPEPPTSTAAPLNATSKVPRVLANKRDKYNIEYIPPPSPYTFETLHWCVSARDKYKIFPNETSSLQKVLLKLDKTYHDRWRAADCHAVCVAADKWEQEKEQKYISLIASYPHSREKRVISFSLYGSNPKYTQGAVRNAELVGTYFPGWVCRFYVGEVPEHILSRLKALGSEVYPMSNYGNMLSRFLVAADPTVDRYIIRDTDSRLNQRDRLAVEEWIDSGMKIHSIRDHINHCHPLMGGMWGGVKDAIPGFEAKVRNLLKSPLAKEYMTDMHFLRNIIWPGVQKMAFQHDIYCCKGFPGSVSLPTRRPLNYLHVGQIFDEGDNPVMLHIENHIRDFPNPPVCRDVAHSDWIYG